MADIDLRDAATAALDLVGADPHAALSMADEVVAAIPRQNRSPEQVQALAMAHRAAGLALSEVPDMPEAERRLRTSVRLARSAKDPTRAAEAAMSLSFVLQERGRVPAALRTIDNALKTVDGLLAARLRSHRALALQELGRTQEALADYAEALRVVTAAGDPLAEARLRNNRAPVWVRHGDVNRAERDLRIAGDLFRDLGLPLYVAQTQYNLASIFGEAGRVPEALQLLDESIASFDRVEQPLLWMTRCELLLSVGLAGEAAAAARQALERLSSQGTGWELRAAEAHFRLAMALLSVGDDVAAARHAATSRPMFDRQGRAAWAALADYVLSRAQLHLRSADAVSEAAGAIARLDRWGWDQYSIDLRVSLAYAARDVGDLGAARHVLDGVRTTPTSSLAVQQGVAHAQALRCQLDGDEAGFLVRLRRAWRLDDRQRSLLGATELRASSASRSFGVVRLGVDHAVAAGSAREAFAWAERGRAGAYRFAPATPPRDEDLAGALADLRWVAEEDEQNRLGGRPDDAQRRRRLRAEQRVLRLTRQAAGSSRAPAPVAVGAVRDGLGHRVFLEFVSTSSDLAVVVVDSRASRLVMLGPAAPVAEAVDQADFALRRLATGFGAGGAERSAAMLSLLDDAACRLDEHLLTPVRRLLGDREVVISPARSLWMVPWARLDTLRGRATSVAPSATLWLRATQLAVPRSPRVLAVAGPRLAAAEREVVDVASYHPGAVVLVGARATAREVLSRLPHSDVAHLAVHGDLRSDNPLFSTLRLFDGPLYGYDLERLDAMPHTVLVPACHSGGGRAPAGEEMLGLCWTMMGAGAATVVAPARAIPDAAAAVLMGHVHAGLARGETAAAALAGAQDASDRDDPAAVAAAAAFFSCGA